MAETIRNTLGLFGLVLFFGQRAILFEAATLRRLRALRAVCAAVADRVGAQWVGVYQVVPASDAAARFGGDAAAPNLLKLAYVGAPSRPYFPLTAAFAAGSNNSSVAMSGEKGAASVSAQEATEAHQA